MKGKLTTYGPILVFIATLLWATDAPFRVHLTDDLSGSFIVFIEHLISLIILIPLLFPAIKELKTFTKKEWLSVVTISIGGSALALILFTQAFSYMNPSVAIILQKIQPFIAILLASYILNEVRSKQFWVYSIIAFIGAYVVSFPRLIPQLYVGEVFNPHFIGVLCAIGAAILWGASTVFGKHLLQKRSIKTVTTLRFFFAFLFLLIWNVSNGAISQISTLQPKDWLFLLIIALTSGVVSLFIYYKGLNHTKASIATIAELGFVPAAVLVNYFFLGETLVTMQLVGMVILLFAVFNLSKINQTTEKLQSSDMINE